MVQAGQDHRLNDGVNLRLRELREDGGGGLASPDQPFEVRNAVFTEA
jgi:hypothetical protein